MNKFSTDVWFVAFLMSKGHKISAYTVLPQKKVRCEFQLSDKEWQDLKLEFNNSEIVKFKGYIDQIKDLAW